MKRYSIIAVCVGTVLTMYLYLCYLQGENNSLKMSKILYESENRLLKDQIHEMESKSVSARTYEEGLTEGLIRSNNRGYTDGYHAAMSQVAEQQAEKEKKTKVGN